MLGTPFWWSAYFCVACRCFQSRNCAKLFLLFCAGHRSWVRFFFSGGFGSRGCFVEWLTGVMG